MKLFWSFCLVAFLASCSVPPPPPAVHYTLGQPYEADGVWQYPAADFSYDATGIATVEHGSHAPLTTDGEVYSQRAFAGAHPTLELPAIVRVTNLENGRQVVVRVNDRGPANPGRVIALTETAARALGFAQAGTARVRVQVLAKASERLALSLPGGPRIPVARAPVGSVGTSELPPPPGAEAEGTPALARDAGPTRVAAKSSVDLPGTLSRVAPDPGAIWVRTGVFTGARYASLQAAALTRFGAQAVPRSGSGSFGYEVRVGPFGSVAKADAALKEVLLAGFTGARLVVE